MADQKKQEDDLPDDVKDDVVEYFGADGEQEDGPRFVDAGMKEKDERGDDFGEGTSVVG